MTQEDREILIWYFYGFNDELNNKSRLMDCTSIQHKAYIIGKRHAFIGDDMPSIDYMTDAETLKIIKDEYQNDYEKVKKDLLQD
jgi:hypothetical protein